MGFSQSADYADLARNYGSLPADVIGRDVGDYPTHRQYRYLLGGIRVTAPYTFRKISLRGLFVSRTDCVAFDVRWHQPWKPEPDE